MRMAEEADAASRTGKWGIGDFGKEAAAAAVMVGGGGSPNLGMEDGASMNHVGDSPTTRETTERWEDALARAGR
jgi:hypothetical protein